MNASDPCMPWYFPITNDSNARLCDPWEAREFRKIMSKIPVNNCSHCLPDCNATMYKASTTAAPIRRCDYKNLGVNFLCTFDEQIQGKRLEPSMWADNVLKQYMEEVKEIPDYLKTLEQRSNKRLYVDEKAAGKQVFSASNVEIDGSGQKIPKSYDAYEKDIAMVTFFFESSTIFEFKREQRMTLVGYISQMGGLLGLCMGFSFISAVEILYWFTIRMARNI